MICKHNQIPKHPLAGVSAHLSLLKSQSINFIRESYDNFKTRKTFKKISNQTNKIEKTGQTTTLFIKMGKNT